MIDQKIRNRIALVLAFSFIGFLIWSSVTFQAALTNYLPYFTNLTRQNPMLSIFIFIALSTLSTMFSSFIVVPLVPIAVLVWGGWITALYLFVGWTTGDVFSYGIAYYAGNPIVKRLVSFDRIEYYQKKIPRNAEFRLIFFFIMSMPSEIPGYSLGTLRYNFKIYFLITALGELIWAPLTVLAAQALVQNKPVVFIVLIFFMALFFFYSFSLFKKYLRKGD